MKTVRIALMIAGAFAIFSSAISLNAASLKAAEPKTELLWSNGAPGAKGEAPADKPTLITYLPDGDAPASGRTAIVICPGGGYGGLAMDHEGHQIGRWLNDNGIAGFICDYRHRGKGYGQPAPLQDVQRAIRTVRAHAKELGVDPKKIGVLGFSAGGHLASTAVTMFDEGKADATDPIEKVSSRPDFGILCYPVIAFEQSYTHKGSQENLVGKDASADLIAQWSTEKRVTAKTPPTFLWHTFEDTGVPPMNSIAFYQAMVANKVPGELHIYEKGQHGIGLGKTFPASGDWSNAALRWLGARELWSGKAK